MRHTGNGVAPMTGEGRSGNHGGLLFILISRSCVELLFVTKFPGVWEILTSLLMIKLISTFKTILKFVLLVISAICATEEPYSPMRNKEIGL